MEKIEEPQSYKQILFKAIEQARVSIASPETLDRETSVCNAIKGLISVIQNHGSSLVGTEVQMAHSEMWDKYELEFGTREYTPGEGNVIGYYERLFEKILFILNKHSMLFDEAPVGYSNCTMTGATKEQYIQFEQNMQTYRIKLAEYNRQQRELREEKIKSTKESDKKL